MPVLENRTNIERFAVLLILRVGGQIELDADGQANMIIDAGGASGAGDDSQLLFRNQGANKARIKYDHGITKMHFELTDVSNLDTEVLTLVNSGNVGIGTTTPTEPLEMASGAHFTVGGVWTDASLRDYKENIEELAADEAFEAFTGLTPVKYNYKTEQAEQYVGFIAEDVPQLVATGNRKSLSPMDIVGVLTKVTQKQQSQIEAQQQHTEALKAELQERLNSRSSSSASAGELELFRLLRVVL